MKASPYLFFFFFFSSLICVMCGCSVISNPEEVHTVRVDIRKNESQDWS